MKLTTIYNRYLIYTLFAVLVLGSVTHYYVFRHSIHRSTDNMLREYQQQVIDYANKNDTLVSLRDLEMRHDCLLCTQIESGVEREYAIYDSLIYSPHQKEKIVYRVLNFDVMAGSKIYRVTLSQPTLEEEDLISAVVISLGLLFIFFIIASFLVSSYYAHIIWNPFYKLLSGLRRYKVEKTAITYPSCSGVDEFDEINMAVYKMMLQIRTDYNSLKELTEDTSHELQTPLSILKSKLEILQQIDMGNEKSMELIRSMQGTINRMSNFNRSMLFITKIKNKQFIDIEDVNLEELINEYLVTCEDILINKEIKVDCQYDAKFIVKMNRILADRLIINIMSNALRYNINNGTLNIIIDKDKLCVSNTYNHILPKGDLFERFIKSSHDKDSSGLGLTIVKNICTNSGLQVELQITETVFSIVIHKKQGK
ncbi:MAG: HAMP domain-containing sensor histidine kinase [Rikenellaceae bacterium]